METTTNKPVATDQLKELLSKITQGEWRVDNGYKNGQILPNNCFYLRNDKDEMVATIYKKIDSEMQSLAPTLAKEVIELREENLKLNNYIDVENAAYEKLSNDNRVLREALTNLINIWERPDGNKINDGMRQEMLGNMPEINKYIAQANQAINNTKH